MQVVRKKLSLIVTILLLLLFPKAIYAAPSATTGCYNWNSPNLGEYLDCVIPALFNVAQLILVALAIIMTILLLYKTFKTLGEANSQELQELPQKWVYIFLLALLTFGAGGTILNIILRLLGFGTVQTWLNILNEWLCKWGGSAAC